MSITLLFAMSPVDSTFTVNLSCAYLFLFFFTKKKTPLSPLSRLVSSSSSPQASTPSPTRRGCRRLLDPSASLPRRRAPPRRRIEGTVLSSPPPSFPFLVLPTSPWSWDPSRAGDCCRLLLTLLLGLRGFFFRGVWFDIGESNPSLHLRIAASVTGTAP